MMVVDAAVNASLCCLLRAVLEGGRAVSSIWQCPLGGHHRHRPHEFMGSLLGGGSKLKQDVEVRIPLKSCVTDRRNGL
jgi:hypothetical protein